jgi:hypothetical protein
MERCNGCEYEYDGICTAKGIECSSIAFCDVITNKVREEVSKAPTIEKGENRYEKNRNKHDNVNHPEHYEGHCSIECIDAMIMTFGVKRTAEYCVQNAYKYVWRYKYKNRLEDLKKAEWYVDKFEELSTVLEQDDIIGQTEMRYREISRILKRLIKKGREGILNGKGNE